MENSKKIILDLCGGTGSWSKPYREASYDVRLITLPDYDVLKWRQYPEIVGHIEAGNVYGILVAPPCTMFSLARQNAKTPRDLAGAMEVVKVCLEIIWTCRAKGPLKFWALENPREYLRQFLGKPPFKSKAWYYERAEIEKPTDLLGYFKEPSREFLVKPSLDYRQVRWQAPRAPAGYEHLTDRAAIRAITPRGFARAFFKTNQ